jgi:hypothetical protein
MGKLIPAAHHGWQPPLQEPSSFEVRVQHEYAMLSGPEVVNNHERRQQLLHYCPDAIGIEMEGQGKIDPFNNLSSCFFLCSCQQIRLVESGYQVR